MSFFKALGKASKAFLSEWSTDLQPTEVDEPLESVQPTEQHVYPTVQPALPTEQSQPADKPTTEEELREQDFKRQVSELVDAAAEIKPAWASSPAWVSSPAEDLFPDVPKEGKQEKPYILTHQGIVYAREATKNRRGAILGSVAKTVDGRWVYAPHMGPPSLTAYATRKLAARALWKSLNRDQPEAEEPSVAKLDANDEETPWVILTNRRQQRDRRSVAVRDSGAPIGSLFKKFDMEQRLWGWSWASEWNGRVIEGHYPSQREAAEAMWESYTKHLEDGGDGTKPTEPSASDDEQTPKMVVTSGGRVVLRDDPRVTVGSIYNKTPTYWSFVSASGTSGGGTKSHCLNKLWEIHQANTEPTRPYILKHTGAVHRRKGVSQRVNGDLLGQVYRLQVPHGKWSYTTAQGEIGDIFPSRRLAAEGLWEHAESQSSREKEQS